MSNVDLTVELMGREFKIACPAQEEAALREAVTFLNERLEKVRGSGKVVGGERVALLVALQIAHEFLAPNARAGFDLSAVQSKIKNIQQLAEAALAEARAG